uniref:Uncharacterized protein n=1 Tax=Anguilla anguilla TaxID=7936 RepID=A0A0E9QQK1_ANGAN
MTMYEEEEEGESATQKPCFDHLTKSSGGQNPACSPPSEPAGGSVDQHKMVDVACPESEPPKWEAFFTADPVLTDEGSELESSQNGRALSAERPSPWPRTFSVTRTTTPPTSPPSPPMSRTRN